MNNGISKTVYLSQSKYAEISKDLKGVKMYANPYVKVCGCVRYQIVPSEEVCTTKVLSEDEKLWFTSIKTKEEVVMLSLKVMGWFPTELIAGVNRCVFSMDTTLSKKTGWITPNGCLGSRSALFLKSKVNVAIDILNKSGFDFENVK